YLYMGDWDNAEKYSKAVMDKVKLSPRSEYVEMYRNAGKTAGAETILRLNNYDVTLHMKSMTDPTVSYDMVPNEALISLYEPGDVRLEMMTYVGEPTEEQYAGKSFTACTKYCAYKSIADTKERRCDPFVLRCSEMYLIHAEALCNKGNLEGAAADLKAIEARALGVGESAVTIHYTDAASLANLIEKERIKELCFEGHRLFDIIRLGHDLVRPDCTTSTTKTIKYPDHRFILPICQMEMQSNENMVQNEGYSSSY
ncbi:MAG: RagB/SusD family nutrient uptake outer membrane protein, partial [Bacteroidales bacterium]|nr:RagB/SusD family nutrient uptake outer membrane protein [Bacteroidales bacterium]